MGWPACAAQGTNTMALTTVQATGTKPYTVLRAICMAGQRVDVGSIVELTATQGTELASAGKVARYDAEAAAAEAKPTKAAKNKQPDPTTKTPEEPTP